MTKPSLHVESDQQKQAEHKGEVTLIFNHYKYNSCLYWKQQYYYIYILSSFQQQQRWSSANANETE